jgi:hypothetical protein
MVDKPSPKKITPTPPPPPKAAVAPAKAAPAPAPAPAAAGPAISPKKMDAKPKTDSKERHRLIQEAAYFRSLKHSGVDPSAHWLAAEKEVDQRLK